MDAKIHNNKSFESIDFSEHELFDYEYTKCTFTNCNFSKSNLRSSDFVNCTFTGCNFSLALLDNTGLKTVNFIACKLIGINFSACSSFLFSVGYKECHIDYSSFFQRKMKKTIFSCCSLKEVDFEEADLSSAAFNDSDLYNARFINSNLEKTDFRTASNYALDPGANKMKGAKFAYSGIAGLLAKYDIDIEYD